MLTLEAFTSWILESLPPEGQLPACSLTQGHVQSFLSHYHGGGPISLSQDLTTYTHSNTSHPLPSWAAAIVDRLDTEAATLHSPDEAEAVLLPNFRALALISHKHIPHERFSSLNPRPSIFPSSKEDHIPQSLHLPDPPADDWSTPPCSWETALNLKAAPGPGRPSVLIRPPSLFVCIRTSDNPSGRKWVRIVTAGKVPPIPSSRGEVAQLPPITREEIGVLNQARHRVVCSLPASCDSSQTLVFVNADPLAPTLTGTWRRLV